MKRYFSICDFVEITSKLCLFIFKSGNECYVGTRDEKVQSQFYPTFISEVSGQADKDILKNLKFHKCSYFKSS